MKRILLYLKKTVIIAIILLVFSFSGCNNTSNSALPYEFDTDGNYSGFKDMPEHYTAEQAEKDGCYVVVNSQITAGEQLWKDFIEDTLNKSDASIRIALFGDDYTSYQDLFYTDSYYHIFSAGSDDLDDVQEHTYKYLLILEGTLPNAAKSGKVTILTDDKSLTYDDIMWQVLSSNPKPISSYEVVLVDWE